VTREVDERGVLIVLDVAPEDMGMIIGRQGSTAKAIRTLLRVIGARSNARVNLKINEPEGSEFAKKREEEAAAKEAAASEAPEAPEAESTEKSIDDIVNDIE
jgi:predicted RNA-binding protein YlqC (UPF0109 family)